MRCAGDLRGRGSFTARPFEGAPRVYRRGRARVAPTWNAKPVRRRPPALARLFLTGGVTVLRVCADGGDGGAYGEGLLTGPGMSGAVSGVLPETENKIRLIKACERSWFLC